MLHMSAQCYEHRFGYCTNAKTCFNVHIGAILAERRVLLGQAFSGTLLVWTEMIQQVKHWGWWLQTATRNLFRGVFYTLPSFLPIFLRNSLPFSVHFFFVAKRLLRSSYRGLGEHCNLHQPATGRSPGHKCIFGVFTAQKTRLVAANVVLFLLQRLHMCFSTGLSVIFLKSYFRGV